MSNTIEHKKIVPGINSFTFSQLREAFFKTVEEENGKVSEGFRSQEHGGWVNLEDSLPWFEIEFEGNSSTKKAKDFCQKLSDNMNILIYFNRVVGYGNNYAVFGVMDFDYELLEDKIGSKEELSNSTIVLPPLSDNEEWFEFMDGYGTKIFPTHTKKTTKKKLK